MTEQMRWFLQWSQLHDAWHCMMCMAVAKGEKVVTICDGKAKTTRKQNYYTLIHTTVSGEGNRLVHKTDCKYYESYFNDIQTPALAS